MTILQPHFPGVAQVAVAQVEAFGSGIVFQATPNSAQRRSTAPGRAERVPGAGAADQWDGRESGCSGSRWRAAREPSSLRGTAPTCVNAGDDDIHSGRHFVVQVERAIGKDVDLDAGKDADPPLQLLVDFADGAMCSSARASSRPLIMARFFEWSVIAMYSSPRAWRLRPSPDGVVAVAGRGVHVHVALNVAAPQ